MNKLKVIIVTLKKWNLINYEKFKKKYKKYKIHLISNREKLKKLF